MSLTRQKAGNLTYKNDGTGAVVRTLKDKLGETVSVKDFGAVGDGVTDDTAAIQAAIDSGASVVFPEGTYLAAGLTQSSNNQKITGIGYVKIIRASGSVLLTCTGRNVSFFNIEFNGESNGSGDLVVCSGDIKTFTNCSSRTNSGHALWCKGSSNLIHGSNDIYYSAGTSSFSDAAIAFGDAGSPVNYNKISNINTSTSTYGVLLIEAGTTGITNCQLGNVDTTDGGAYITNTRIVGTLDMGTFTFINNSTISGDVTIGDGITTQGALGFGPNIAMQSGTTITLNKMREAHVSIAHFGNAGITIVDNLTGDPADIGNSIFLPPIAFTPSWKATTTNPTIGNGTLSGFYTRTGSRIHLSISMLAGSTTSFGTGTWYFSLPAPAKSRFGGTISAEDSGSAYYYGSVHGGGDFFGDNFRIVNQANGNQWNPTTPYTWASGDKFFVDVEYTVDNT